MSYLTSAAADSACSGWAAKGLADESAEPQSIVLGGENFNLEFKICLKYLKSTKPEDSGLIAQY